MSGCVMLCIVLFFLVLYVFILFIFFFFFKQKTAYEMRISDWSSDVCSSDLCPSERSCGCVKLCVNCGFQAEGVNAVPLRTVDGKSSRIDAAPEIGRASCRERVCPYV